MLNSGKRIFVWILLVQLYWLNIIGVCAEEGANHEEVLNLNNNLGEYKVFVNDEDVDSYNLLEGNNIKFEQKYNGDMNECYYESPLLFDVDFSKRLYGVYNYDFSLVCNDEVVGSKNIAINYIGDNNKFINSNEIYYINDNYFILGKKDLEYNKSDIMLMFNQSLGEYNAVLDIISYDGEKLLDSDTISNGDRLVVDANYDDYGNINNISNQFIINIVYDVNEDSIIDTNDIKDILIRQELNSNDSVYDIVDIVGGSINDEIQERDNLVKFIEYNDFVNVYDLVEIKYYINGFNKDVLSGIQGDIKFDDKLLELVDIKLDKFNGDFNSSGKFLYLLDNYNKNGLFITFYFKTLDVGNANISLDDFKLVTGNGDYALLDNSLFSIDVVIDEYGKGGDPEEDITNDKEKEEIKVNNKVVYEELVPSKNVQYISLSNDNYINSLKIKGYDIDFDKNILEYNINVGNDVDKLELDIKLSDENSYYDIVGNKNFKVGNNIVSIEVTAMDGSVKTYVINVEKSANYIEKEVKKEEDKSKNIIIVLIIFIIVGLVYVILKDDEGDM